MSFPECDCRTHFASQKYCGTGDFARGRLVPRVLKRSVGTHPRTAGGRRAADILFKRGSTALPKLPRSCRLAASSRAKMSQRIALTLLTSGGWTSLVVAAQECSTAGRRCQHHSQEEPASWPKPDPHQHNNLTIPAECQWAIDTLFSRQRADPTRRGDAASVTDTVWSIFLPDGCRPAWPRPRLLTLARGVLRCTTSISPASTAAVRRTISWIVPRQWMRQGAAGLARVPPELCWLPHRRGELQFLHIARVRTDHPCG